MRSLFQLLLAQTHATERRKPVPTDPSSEPLLGKGLDLRVVRVVPKEAAGVVHLPLPLQESGNDLRGSASSNVGSVDRRVGVETVVSPQ